MYLRRLFSLWKSLRSTVFVSVTTILGLMTSKPEEVKSFVSSFVSEQWIADNWSAITSLVVILGCLFFGHGSAREKSTTPLDER